MEDDLTGRQPHRKMTSQEDNLTGRRPYKKTTSQEDNLTEKTASLEDEPKKRPNDLQGVS